MPCWSGRTNVVVKMVVLAVVVRGCRLMRWKGESMVNSSWRLSFGGGWKGTSWEFESSESSIVKVWVVSDSL